MSENHLKRYLMNLMLLFFLGIPHDHLYKMKKAMGKAFPPVLPRPVMKSSQIFAH